jgi:rhamnogalacturonan endolyase
MSFMSGLGLQGWVSSRGRVTGSYSGIPSGIQAVIGWSNSTAQYWTYASGGTFTSPAMIPGTYTMTLYKNELDVASTSVTVGTGSITKNIASAESTPATIWQIGTFDGTPEGFMNASLQTYMHPSDVRMQAWNPMTFTVGSAISGFPMAQFQGQNSPIKIAFTLTSAQVKAHTLRIGTTVSFGTGRPQVTVNPGTSHAFTGPAPGSPTEPSGRSITRGVYHGDYALYTVDIPASAFVAGSNIIQIDILGKGPYGGFLSASLVFDAIELDN